MKGNKLVVNLLAATLLVTPMLVGCKKNPVHPTPIPGISENPGTIEKPAGPMIPGGPTLDMGPGARTVEPKDTTLGGIPQNPDGPHIGWIPDTETFKSQTVYFDFDKSTIRADQKPKLEEVARRMKSEFQGKALKIEGNCDERGTEEYNRALGERRALAVREALVGLGLSALSIETISYGEDRPAVQGHNEAAWSKNRRGDIVLLSPPGASAKSGGIEK